MRGCGEIGCWRSSQLKLSIQPATEGEVMFETNLPTVPDLLRRFTQEDMLATGIRVGLSAAGPIGVIAGEFLTQFVPAQRADRLQDFVEKLADRLSGLEEQFNERLSTTAGYAALAEEASLAAVRTPSAEERSDLAAILLHGLSRDDAEMLEEAALLSLREQLNDAQVVILMSYGNFLRTMGDDELDAFRKAHPGVFDMQPLTMGSSEEERRRWAMREHFEGQLEALGLLRDREGVIKSGQRRKYEITHLGRLLLQAIGRYRDPKQGRERR